MLDPDLEKEKPKDENVACLNTDRELWRRVEADYFSASIHVTEHGAIGIAVGGLVVVLSVEKWHALGRAAQYELAVPADGGAAKCSTLENFGTPHNLPPNQPNYFSDQNYFSNNYKSTAEFRRFHPDAKGWTDAQGNIHEFAEAPLEDIPTKDEPEEVRCAFSYGPGSYCCGLVADHGPIGMHAHTFVHPVPKAVAPEQTFEDWALGKWSCADPARNGIGYKTAKSAFEAGRRSVANQLKEWCESQTNIADPSAYMIVGRNPSDAYKFMAAKCDDLTKEK